MLLLYISTCDLRLSQKPYIFYYNNFNLAHIWSYIPTHYKYYHMPPPTSTWPIYGHTYPHIIHITTCLHQLVSMLHSLLPSHLNLEYPNNNIANSVCIFNCHTTSFTQWYMLSNNNNNNNNSNNNNNNNNKSGSVLGSVGEQIGLRNIYSFNLYIIC